MRAHVYSDLKDLPESYTRLFEQAAGRSFYYSLPWFQNLVATARDAGERLVLIGVEAGAEARALLVARSPNDGARQLRGYAPMYTTLFGPVLADTPSDAAADMAEEANALARALADARPRWQAINFDALDVDAPFYGAFARALGAAGFAVQRYFHFGNQFEPIAEPTLDAYLKKRPSQLRNTLKRKGKKLEKRGGIDYLLVMDEEGLEGAIDAYQAVYAQSWKEPEPYPDFTAGLARAAARAGTLRMGVMWVDGTPAAAQIWIVSGGTATIFKLAYDEQFKSLSIGSVLSRNILKHVIEIDGAKEIDFGRGDDPYKAQWMAERRERWGIAAYNPRTPAGLLGAGRNVWARAVMRKLGAGR